MSFNSLYELDKDLSNFIEGFIEGGRQLMLTKKVSEEVVTPIAGKMIQMDVLEVKPITLLIHCPGGSYKWAYYLKNIIDALNSPVHGLVIGGASSIAVDVLQMCAKRMMLPHATLFNHFMRTGEFEVISRDDDFELEDAQAIRQHVLKGKHKREEFFSKRTGNSIEKIKRFFQYGEDYNLSMSAEEAVEAGFADEIVKDFNFFPGYKGKNFKG